MYVCIFVCEYVCVSVCTYVCRCIYEYVCIYTWKSKGNFWYHSSSTYLFLQWGSLIHLDPDQINFICEHPGVHPSPSPTWLSLGLQVHDIAFSFLLRPSCLEPSPHLTRVTSGIILKDPNCTTVSLSWGSTYLISAPGG